MQEDHNTANQTKWVARAIITMAVTSTLTKIVTSLFLTVGFLIFTSSLIDPSNITSLATIAGLIITCILSMAYVQFSVQLFQFIDSYAIELTSIYIHHKSGINLDHIRKAIASSMAKTPLQRAIEAHAIFLFCGAIALLFLL